MQKYPYFYPGQVVTLCSGGQRMTVKPTDDEDNLEACCIWINAELGGPPVEHSFPRNVLKLEEGQNQYGYERKRFNPGQVVQLRSGEPKMTVLSSQSLAGLLLVSCIWHDKESREPLTAAFPSEMLIAV